jgi:hypothetical protein
MSSEFDYIDNLISSLGTKLIDKLSKEDSVNKALDLKSNPFKNKKSGKKKSKQRFKNEKNTFYDN